MYRNEENLWWWNSQCKTQTPFTLKYVDESGKRCGKCNWSERCYGCPIEIPEPYWRYFSIDWNIDVIGCKDYWKLENTCVSLSEDTLNLEGDVLQLEKVILKAQEEEFMSLKEDVYCS